MIVHQAPAVGWILIVVIAALTTAGFIFSPWVGIATIGFDIFILVSGLSFVIFVYGFNSITGLNMSMHSLAAEEGNLVVKSKTDKFGDSPSANEDKKEEHTEIKIPFECLRPYHIYPGGALIPVEGPRKGFIWVPPIAFDSDSGFSDFMQKLYTPKTAIKKEDNYEGYTE